MKRNNERKTILSNLSVLAFTSLVAIFTFGAMSFLCGLLSSFWWKLAKVGWGVAQ